MVVPSLDVVAELTGIALSHISESRAVELMNEADRLMRMPLAELQRKVVIDEQLSPLGGGEYSTRRDDVGFYARSPHDVDFTLQAAFLPAPDPG